MSLVLSVFPGLGIMDAAFEAAGFTVVRGPDLLWGGDIKSFYPPPNVFRGVIGGIPCQAHSSFVSIIRAKGNRVAENKMLADAVPYYLAAEIARALRRALDGYHPAEDDAFHDHRTWPFQEEVLGDDRNSTPDSQDGDDAARVPADRL